MSLALLGAAFVATLSELTGAIPIEFSDQAERALLELESSTSPAFYYSCVFSGQSGIEERLFWVFPLKTDAGAVFAVEADGVEYLSSVDIDQSRVNVEVPPGGVSALEHYGHVLDNGLREKFTLVLPNEVRRLLTTELPKTKCSK